MQVKRLIEQLKRHEGWRTYPYDDMTGRRAKKSKPIIGNITIGCGRNLTARGLSDDEIAYILNNDLALCKDQLLKIFGSSLFYSISEERQEALMNMIFNLGYKSFTGFKTFIRNIKNRNWKQAAISMKQSKWYRVQAKKLPGLKKRIDELSKIIGG
jgi:GH24 family phage-related lysozyme (muramidase)